MGKMDIFNCKPMSMTDKVKPVSNAKRPSKWFAKDSDPPFTVPYVKGDKPECGFKRSSHFSRANGVC